MPMIDRLKSARGSMAVYVTIVILSMLLVLLALFFTSNAIRKNQLVTALKVKEAYEADNKNAGKIYQGLTKGSVPDSVEDAKPAQDEEVYKFPETTQIEDASGDKIWIPGGFGITSDSATEIDDGVVITDGTNEFVWIPVSDTDLAEMYSTTTPETAVSVTLSQSALREAATTTNIYSKLRAANSYVGVAPGNTSYREPEILSNATYGDASTASSRGIDLLISELGYSGASAQILKNFAQDMVDEYLAVFNSIKSYDGFYIGRYELTGTASKPTVQKNQPVLTAYTTGTSNWYALKDACNKVISGTDKYAQSYMIYGNQWDEVLDWLVDTGARTNTEVYSDSSTWGNYSDYVQITTRAPDPANPKNSGSNDDWKANNIYDLAGNYWEWTQEAFDSNTRVCRGR